MSVKSEIKDYLLTISTLTAYIGERIYWQSDQHGSSYPKIIFKEIDRPTIYQTDDQSQVWKFTFLAEDPFVCEAMRNIVKEYLNRSYGTFGEEEVDFISHINDLEMIERDDKIQELITYFRISYH